jgi:hypothetical protein
MYTTRDRKVFTNLHEAQEHERRLFHQWLDTATVNIHDVLKSLPDEVEEFYDLPSGVMMELLKTYYASLDEQELMFFT